MNQRLIKSLALLVTVMFIHLARAADRPPRLWILPFDNLQNEPSLEYLTDALPALLAVAVSASDEHAVVDRQHLDLLLAEQSLTLDGLTSPTARRRIGKLLGASVLITGSFVQDDAQDLNALRLSLRAADIETGIVTATAEGRGSRRQTGELVGTLYRRLARDMDKRLPDLVPQQIDQAPVANLHFMKGLGHYFNARYSQALAEFSQAAGDEQLRDVSRLWLANSYLAQQQYAHAYLELSRIVEPGSLESQVAARRRLCEQHLAPEELKLIRNLAVRQAPSKE